MTGRDEIRADVAAVQRVAEQEVAREAAEAERRRAAREMDEAERIRADFEPKASDTWPRHESFAEVFNAALPPAPEHYARVERVDRLHQGLDTEVQKRFGGDMELGVQIDRLRHRVVEAYIASGCSLAASVAIGAYLFFTR
jgi:hypothetical protein